MMNARPVSHDATIQTQQELQSSSNDCKYERFRSDVKDENSRVHGNTGDEALRWNDPAKGPWDRGALEGCHGDLWPSQSRCHMLLGKRLAEQGSDND
jgi:hypothetical protein